MKIFLDTANVEQISTAARTGALHGVTTNPSLIAREGRSFAETMDAISSLPGELTVLFEVLALDAATMVTEARELAAMSDRVVVKIPMTRDGISAIRQLADEGITTAATLVFSLNQAILASCASASYVAPFIGRLDDIGASGLDLVRSIKETFLAQKATTQVLAASIRSPLAVGDLFHAGCDVVTMPANIFDSMFNQPLTDKGLARFMEDAKKIART